MIRDSHNCCDDCLALDSGGEPVGEVQVEVVAVGVSCTCLDSI